MKKIILVIPLFVWACAKKNGGNSFADGLTADISRAKTDIGKIKAMGSLAIYYIDFNPRKSDSVMQAAFDVALQSKVDKQEPLLIWYLLDAERQLVLYTYRDRLNNVIDDASKAQKIAGDNGFLDYLAFSYLYLAQASRFLGNFKEAIEWCKKAKDIAGNSKSDSLQLETYSTNSQVSQSLRQMNDALRDASQAYIIAEKTENKNLKLEAYRRLAYLYQDFDSAASIESYKKFIDLSLEQDNKEQLVWAYIGLSGHYALKPEFHNQAARYLQDAEKIVDEIHHESLLTEVRFAIINYYVKTGKIQTMHDTLHKWENDIANFYYNGGLRTELYYRYAVLNYNLGLYHAKKGNTAAADGMFRMAANFCDSTLKFYNGDAAPKKLSYIYFYKGASYHALYFLHKNDARNRTDGKEDSVYRQLTGYFYAADNSLVDAQQIFVRLNDPEDLSNIYQWREELIRDSAFYYHKVFLGLEAPGRRPTLDFAEKAWAVRNTYDSCDKVCQLYKDSKDKAIIISQRQQRENEIQQERQDHVDKIKIAGIVCSLVLVFIALIAGGYLRVPLAVTRGLNFFAFIFLFEFILLISEKWVHSFTHGELLSSLLVKIVLAAFLVPLHHFLEATVIRIIKARAEARAI
ncbi:MAG: hypothetical protein ABUT20_27365 [Bacteroidota bacterium]